MGLKGKTTFELTDVNTGEVEVIEDSNMITNGLQEFLTTYGYFGSNVLADDTIRTNSLWVNLLGGLFLFDTALDEDVTNTFMPAGVKMIGNGSKDISNNGKVTELGSYNSTESGLQSDGSVKLVYDFTTAQANGTIACACLTSKIGGYIGMGNNKTCYYNNKYDIFKYDASNSCYSGISGSEDDETHILYPVYSENAIYVTNPYNITYSSSYASQHWSATGKIQILKVKAGFTSVGIKSNKYLKQIVETYDVDIPQDILNYMGTKTNRVIPIADSLERNIYIIFRSSTSSNNLASGGYLWIMKIDKDMNATAYKLTNNTGYGLDIVRRYIVFDGDYAWFKTYDSPFYLYGIKYSDSTQIIETGVYNRSRSYELFNIGKNLIGMKSFNGSQYAPNVYDVVNNTCKATNGYDTTDYTSNYIPFSDKKGIYLRVYDPSSASSVCSYDVVKDYRYLATINNLSEPVVKTSSKTMKVTYTITEE